MCVCVCRKKSLAVHHLTCGDIEEEYKEVLAEKFLVVLFFNDGECDADVKVRIIKAANMPLVASRCQSSLIVAYRLLLSMLYTRQWY